jgi:glycerol-3-phosphate dehydrogenase (NAD(P)+)
MSSTSVPPRAVTVLGAGNWGTALALHLARRGRPVYLWTRSIPHAQAMQHAGENARYLSGHPLVGVQPTAALDVAAAAAEDIVVAIPSHALRDVLVGLRPHLLARDDAPRLLLAVKGVEVETLLTMAEVAEDVLGEAVGGRLAVLGGPSFAVEVADGRPTAVVVASRDGAVAARFQALLSGDALRVYVSDDVIGVELGGTLKNVIALASGMVDGAGLGLNARAALITRGLAEITRLAVVHGANPATLAGLAGLGDLVLTCTGGPSRNRRVGEALGRGKRLPEILQDLGMVAEGVRNTVSARDLARRHGVEMPIVDTMHAILYGDLTVSEAVERLMHRAPRPERDP